MSADWGGEDRGGDHDQLQQIDIVVKPLPGQKKKIHIVKKNVKNNNLKNCANVNLFKVNWDRNSFMFI